jgi:opacity protein-like surface antigen
VTPRPCFRRALALSVLALLCRAASAAAQSAEAPSPPGAPNPPAPPNPPPAAPSIPEQSVSLADLDSQLGAEPLAAAEPARGLSVYGFADAGWHKYFLRPGSLLGANLYEDNTFLVGNVNVYLSGELGGGWRSLIEVRYTYLPNGSRVVGAAGVLRTSTDAADYTNVSLPRQTGSILIERAWIEYAASAGLSLRLGSWLTPYGIWNEDHGSPTIIPVSRPYVIGLEFLPERQTGLLLSGSAYLSDSLTLGYSLGLSNGRGPIQDYADLDENKAVTARLQLNHHGAGDLHLGAAAYLGRYTNLDQVVLPSADTYVIDDQIREQYDELSWALDARYLLGGLHLQSEFVLSQRKFTDRGRPLRTGSFEFQPDDRRLGGYLLAGYRFDWLGIMPYATAEFTSLLNYWETFRSPTRDVMTVYALGINSRPTTNVTLKLEGNLGLFHSEHPQGSGFEHPARAVQAQVAWAF